MVRRDDHERYLVTLFAPSSAQKNLWALFAFNQEIAKIRESVSETALGEIRLQWWQEVLAEIQAGEIRDQPVIKALAQIDNKEVLWPLLEQVIEARKLDMFASGPADMAALCEYAAGAGGALQQAALHLTLQDKVLDPAAVKAAHAVGCAWVMLGLLRALPAHWQTGRSFVPQEQSAGMGAANSKDAFLQLEPTIKEMRAIAESKIEQALENARDVPQSAGGGLLYIPIMRLHLHALDKSGNNPFEASLFEAGALRKIMALFWANLRTRF